MCKASRDVRARSTPTGGSYARSGGRRDTGKGGTTHEGWPVFNTVSDAVRATGAKRVGDFVCHRRFAADAVMEAADASCRSRCITEGIPTIDMMRARPWSVLEDEAHRAQLSGPHHGGQAKPGSSRDTSARKGVSASCRRAVRSPTRRFTSGPSSGWDRPPVPHRRRSADWDQLHRRAEALRRRFRQRNRGDDRGDRWGPLKKRRRLCREAVRKPSWASSPGRPPRRDGAWATPAPSSPAAKALRPKRWRHWPRPVSTSSRARRISAPRSRALSGPRPPGLL